MTPQTVFSIVGPTATGKTALAFQIIDWLTDEYAGFDVISADSRQVFRDIPIITGADVPTRFEPEFDSSGRRIYVHNSTTIHGVSVISGDQSWSVAHFVELARSVILNAWREQRLPIVVGGTGLYQRWIWRAGLVPAAVPIPAIRRRAQFLPISDLLIWADQVDPVATAALNQSDRMNPRRLIRVIERAQSKDNLSTVAASQVPQPKKHLKVGLKLPLPILQERIIQRVSQRWRDPAAQDEVRRLAELYPDRSLPIWSATGVREWDQFLRQQLTGEECLQNWITRETQYAKRQLTWFAQEPDIHWSLVSSPDWLSKLKTQTDFWH